MWLWPIIPNGVELTKAWDRKTLSLSNMLNRMSRAFKTCQVEKLEALWDLQNTLSETGLPVMGPTRERQQCSISRTIFNIT